MAIVSYNNYAFQEDRVWYTIDKRGVPGQTGRIQSMIVMWHLIGSVAGANTAEVADLEAEVNAIMVPGGDLVMSLGGGVDSLRSIDCVSGTQVSNFKWLSGFDGVRGSGAELLLRRTFSASIWGRVLVPSDTDITSYREQIVGTGTGEPIILPVGSLYGDVQAQQRQLKSWFWARQFGHVTGLTAYPLTPSRLWLGVPGVYYIPDQVSTGFASPDQLGVNQNLGFTINYSFRCWSATQLVGQPIPPL